MAKLEVLIAPHPILSTKSKKIEVIDDSVKTLASDMIETMFAEEGAGLAANQVGVLKQIMILEWGHLTNSGSEARAIINPEIYYFSDETWEVEEGCLSFPTGRVSIVRPQYIKFKFQDINGDHNDIEADGWLARAVMHEMDHLNGITQLEHVSSLKKKMILRKLAKYKKLHQLK